jgi:hypothetical protein
MHELLVFLFLIASDPAAAGKDGRGARGEAVMDYDTYIAHIFVSLNREID